MEEDYIRALIQRLGGKPKRLTPVFLRFAWVSVLLHDGDPNRVGWVLLLVACLCQGRESDREHERESRLHAARMEPSVETSNLIIAAIQAAGCTNSLGSTRML